MWNNKVEYLRLVRLACPSVLALIPAFGWGQALPERDGHLHLGVATCASSQCHGSAVPRSGLSVLQSEYVTWTTADPHSRAYQTLLTEDSRAIANRLGLGAPEEAAACLGCHSDNVPAARRGEQFQISDGVSCEACHGGAEDWLGSHYNNADAGHAENIQAGLFPTDDARTRATLCLSCHLGTAEKFAGHEIMAAGHPRLAFELDTFTELWRLAGNLTHYQVDADYEARKQAPDHVSTWVAGLMRSAEHQLELLSGSLLASGRLFPELGLFDCHACHRTMKSVQWRALSRYGGVGPGSTVLNDSTFVMLLALARALDSAEFGAMEGGVQALHRGIAGGIEEIQGAAAGLSTTLERLDAEVRSLNLTNANKRGILTAILQAGEQGEFVDYVAAEQAFMAVQMLAFDLQDTGLVEELSVLAAALEDDEAYQPTVFARLLSNL